MQQQQAAQRIGGKVFFPRRKGGQRRRQRIGHCLPCRFRPIQQPQARLFFRQKPPSQTAQRRFRAGQIAAPAGQVADQQPFRVSLQRRKKPLD